MSANKLADDELARWTASQAAIRYYFLIDRERFREAADLFSADGEFLRLGATLHGPDEVFAALDGPRTGRVARHFVHNLVIDLDGDDKATASYDLATYGQDPSDDPSVVPAIPPPTAVLDCTDALVRSSGEWRIAKKSVKAVWRGSAR